jgi:hypothetical protein
LIFAFLQGTDAAHPAEDRRAARRRKIFADDIKTPDAINIC